MGVGISAFGMVVKIGRERPLLLFSNTAVIILDSAFEHYLDIAEERQSLLGERELGPADGSRPLEALYALDLAIPLAYDNVQTITSWFTQGFYFTVKEKPLLIRRALEQCLNQFRGSIVARNDKGVIIHVYSGIEILLAAAKRESPEQVDLATDILQLYSKIFWKVDSQRKLLQ
jgi:hypothetical protein